MITKVEVRNSQGDMLPLLLNSQASGFLVEEIGGLGPVKATIVSSTFAGVDGESYQSSRREGRDVSLKINLKPDSVGTSVFDLRQKLYRFFMTKKWVSLRFFMTSTLYVDIEGRVESADPDIFTKEPKFNVSVRCGKPDFIDPNPVSIDGHTTSLPMAETFEYFGSVETGMLFTLRPDRTINEFAIYNTPTDGQLRTLEFSTPLQAGDVLQISTVKGSKGAILTRGNTVSSVLFGVSPESNWVEMFEGDNLFRVYAEGAPIPYNIQYTTKYGGL